MTARAALRFWPLAVPVVWAAAVLAVMGPDSMGHREAVPFPARWMIYDPSDIGAFVLRGANAASGRLPGRRDEPAWTEPEDLAARLAASPQPLADRYYLEYPSATLVLFRLGFPTGCDLPAAVADSHHYGVAHFVPKSEAERRLWSQFHRAAVIHIALMAAALVGLMVVLRRGYEPGGPTGPVWLAALPAAVYFSLHRFDVVPALATALGLACLGRGRLGWSGAFFAAGMLLKVYPVLFVPIILRYLGPARGTRWLGGFATVALGGVGLSWAVLGWEPTVRPVLVQLARPLEASSWTLYGRILPLALGHHGTARLALLSAVVLAVVVTRPLDLASVLRRCTIVLTVFVALAVFWSPQWVVWFLPFIVPLAARHRWVGGVAAALDLLNYFSFPILFWILWNTLLESVVQVLVFAAIVLRAGLWCGLAGGLAWAEWRSRRGVT